MSSKCIRDTVSKVKTKYQESDPYRLAAAMHIIVKKLPLGTDPNCCKGFCMRECRKTCIVINCDLPEIIQQIILIHEIGHALVAAKQTDSAPVTKITIVPRTSGALGYTMQVDEGEHNLMSKDELLNKVATLTGGRAAEELIFGSITTGASNDIEQATKLTRSMITRYGMSRKFDMVALETVTNQYLSGDTALACSAETAAKIDEEVIATVKTAHEKAIGILQNNMDALHRLAHFLLEKETITGEELSLIHI